jgi:hypothetical protein
VLYEFRNIFKEIHKIWILQLMRRRSEHNEIQFCIVKVLRAKLQHRVCPNRHLINRKIQISLIYFKMFLNSDGINIPYSGIFFILVSCQKCYSRTIYSRPIDLRLSVTAINWVTSFSRYHDDMLYFMTSNQRLFETI